MPPEQYIYLFMQPRSQRRSFPDQSQYDYELDVLNCCERRSIFKRAFRFFAGIRR